MLRTSNALKGLLESELIKLFYRIANRNAQIVDQRVTDLQKEEKHFL
jgi:hypothetical protein